MQKVWSKVLNNYFLFLRVRWGHALNKVRCHIKQDHLPYKRNFVLFLNKFKLVLKALGHRGLWGVEELGSETLLNGDRKESEMIQDKLISLFLFFLVFLSYFQFSSFN